MCVCVCVCVCVEGVYITKYLINFFVYTLPVRSIWLPSKIFISHPKSVVFNETSLAPHIFKPS